MLSVKNSNSKDLKGVSVSADFYHPDGQLLFTDRQKVDLKARTETDVYFTWSNPAASLVDRAEITISGHESAGTSNLKHTVKYPNPR